MPDSPWYKDWFNSPYYHLLYSSRDIGEATTFIDRLIAHLRPATDSRMLDVACGKGRHSIILNRRGFDVTGIDLSENSIAAALAHENERLHFFTHDMRLPFWINYFDYAFNFFTSFGYFNTQRDNQNAVGAMSRALCANGMLTLDYLNVHYAENHLRHRETKHIEGATFYLTRWLDEDFFYKKIEIEDEERLEEPIVFTERVHKFSLGDFNDMFAYERLQIVDVFGDYTLGRYDVDRSPRLIMIAKNKRMHWIIQRDVELFLIINGRWTNGALDYLCPLFRNAFFWAPLYMFLAVFMLVNYRKSALAWIFFFLLTFAVTDMTSSSLIKPWVGRLRPCTDPVMQEYVRMIVNCGGRLSFPSTHATNHFGLAMFAFLTLPYPLRIRWLFFIWAFAIAYSQIYVGVHYPLDTLAGALLGVLVGSLSAMLFKRFSYLHT